jgi:hypothetical protein
VAEQQIAIVLSGRAQGSSASWRADRPRQVHRDPALLLVIALRASGGSGPHAEAARQVVLLVLVAQLLAGAQHDGPPHAAERAPRHLRARRSRRPHIESLSGRRPRG